MTDKVHVEILKTISVLMTTAFAFVAGSAWNSAIQALLDQFIQEGSGVNAMLIYAIIVTVIAVVVTLLIGRLVGRAGIDLEDEL